MNQNFNSIEEILSYINHKCNIACKNAAVIFGNKIHDIYRTAIEHFYQSYSPNIYERTESLYRGELGVGGDGIYYKQLAQARYLSGITVGAENIPGEPYVKNPPHGWNLSKFEIFERSYEKGIHGFSLNDLRILNKGRDKENRVSFKTVPNVAPKKPAREMKSEFRKIATKKYGENTLLKEELNKAFGTNIF